MLTTAGKVERIEQHGLHVGLRWIAEYRPQDQCAVSGDFEYVGFWLRVGAAIIDTVLICLIIGPILTAVYGSSYWTADKLIHGPLDFLVSWVLPAIAIVIFWIARQATPGKMAIKARIVDADTLGHPTTGQLVIRYLGYYVSIFPLMAGLIWVAFDPRKQGWHDKLAGTVVIRDKRPKLKIANV